MLPLPATSSTASIAFRTVLHSLDNRHHRNFSGVTLRYFNGARSLARTLARAVITTYPFSKEDKSVVIDKFLSPSLSAIVRVRTVFRVFNFSNRRRNISPVNLGVFMIRETVSFKLHTLPFPRAIDSPTGINIPPKKAAGLELLMRPGQRERHRRTVCISVTRLIFSHVIPLRVSRFLSLSFSLFCPFRPVFFFFS